MKIVSHTERFYSVFSLKCNKEGNRMVMDELNNTRKGFLKTKSFYAIAAMCILAVGAGVWVAVMTDNQPDLSSQTTGEYSTIDWENSGGRILPSQEDPQVNIPATNVPDTRVPSAQSSTQTTEEKTTQDKQNTPYTGSFALPMGTDILKDYSNGEMVRNKTMGDWRLHNGVDFGGALGNSVSAIQNGTVKKVYNDAFWGTVVEIEHGNGLIAKYCGLEKGSTVQADKTVKQYDVVGKLGVIPVEEADTPHLHLEITVNGKTVDPLEAMNKVGSKTE